MAKRKFEVGQLVELKKSKKLWWTPDIGHFRSRVGYHKLGRVVEITRMGENNRRCYVVHILGENLEPLFDRRAKVIVYQYSYELNPKEIEIKLEDLI